MATINVKTITEISVEMTLDATEHKQLVFFLKHGVTPPQAPQLIVEPNTDIVGRLARALMDKGPR